MSVVAVAIGGVEGNHDMGSDPLDHRNELRRDGVERDGGRPASGDAAVHPGVSVVEQFDVSHAKERGGLTQFAFADHRELLLCDAAAGGGLACLATGGATHEARHAPGRGMQQQRATAERLVIGRAVLAAKDRDHP